MKNLFLFLLQVVVLSFLVSCKEKQEDNNPFLSSEVKVTAVLKSFSENENLSWEEGDVLYLSTMSNFKELKSSKLKLASGVGTATGVFSGTVYGLTDDPVYVFYGNNENLQTADSGVQAAYGNFSPVSLNSNLKEASMFFGKAEKISENEFRVDLNSPCALLNVNFSNAPDNSTLLNVALPADAMNSNVVYNVSGSKENSFTTNGEEEILWNVSDKGIVTENGVASCLIPVFVENNNLDGSEVKLVFSDGKAYKGIINGVETGTINPGEISEANVELSEDNEYVPTPVGVRKVKTYQLGEALMFYGDQKAYGSAISVNGNCIAAYGDYVYVGWWKGGLKNRNLMLTRFNTVSKTLATIEFPHKHVGYLGQYYLAEQKNPDADLTNLKGDSHNTVAVGICPKDGTIHLAYDLHGYDKYQHKWPYFNYNVSKKNSLNVSDEEFTLDLFGERLDYLPGFGKDATPDHQTYPNFLTMYDGRLVYYYRYGPSGNGDSFLILYNGDGDKKWTTPKLQLNEARKYTDKTKQYSIYGSMKYINNKFSWGFHIRHYERPSEIRANHGAYFMDCVNPFENGNKWMDAFDEEHQLPVQDISPFEFKPDPIDYGTSITSGPSFVETKDETLHLVTKANQTVLHYVKLKGADNFTVTETQANGELFALGNVVFLAGLKNKHSYIASTGNHENNFQKLFHDTTEEYSVVKSIVANGKLYLFVMDASGNTNSEPVYLVEYELLY